MQYNQKTKIGGEKHTAAITTRQDASLSNIYQFNKQMIDSYMHEACINGTRE